MRKSIISQATNSFAFLLLQAKSMPMVLSCLQLLSCRLLHLLAIYNFHVVFLPPDCSSFLNFFPIHILHQQLMWQRVRGTAPMSERLTLNVHPWLLPPLISGNFSRATSFTQSLRTNEQIPFLRLFISWIIVVN